jgi:hypothetical protein
MISDGSMREYFQESIVDEEQDDQANAGFGLML